MPHELDFMGVYVSPYLPLFFLGVLIALGTAFLLNKSGLSGWFANPPWVFVALIALAVCLLMSLEGLV